MTCQIANVLQKKGVEKGDVVFIYMPSSPMAVASMLACTRIGAIHRYTITIYLEGGYFYQSLYGTKQHKSVYKLYT